MNYKNLFLDIDGVILNKEDDTSLSLWKKLNQLINKNVSVSFLTARPYGLSEHLLKKLNYKGVHILDNGAFIYDSDNKSVLYNKKIEAEIVKSIIEILPENCRFGVSDEIKFYCNIQYYDNLKGYMPSDRILLYQGNYTANSIWIRDVKENLVNLLEEKFNSKVEIYRHLQHDGLNSIFIHPLSINKESGLKNLKTILGFKFSETCFIGDDSRDMECLKLVGLPACPANAKDEVKKICKLKSKFKYSRGTEDVLDKFF